MTSTPRLLNTLLTSTLAFAVTTPSLAAVHRIPGSIIPSRIQTEVVPLPRPLPATQIHYADFPTCKINSVFHNKKIRFNKVLIHQRNGLSYTELDQITQQYLGYLINEQNVQQLSNRVAQFYRQRGFFAAQVEVPSQSFRKGNLVLIVHVGAVSQVQIENKSSRIQPTLQYYADQIHRINNLTAKNLENQILLAGEIIGSRLKAEILPDEQYPGCVKVNLSADLKRFSADIGYDNYGVRWQGPQEYSANLAANSIIQAGDHSHINGLISADGKELQYYAAEHNMPIGYSGTRLIFWANYAKNEPEFTMHPFDFESKAFSGGAVASHPILLTKAEEFWAKLGLRFVDEKINLHDHRFIDDGDRVLEAAVNYDFHDCWQGETQAEIILSHGFDILGASAPRSPHFGKFRGEVDFTKLNANVNYTSGLYNHFSLRVGGQGQYGFNELIPAELIGVGGRYWGRAYDWSEIMGDTGLVGTVELRYDTKPGAPFNKNTQYFIAYDAGEVWIRHASHRFHHQSLTSVQAGLRCDFTRFFSADLVVAKPLTRDVLANELSGHSGDKVRAFFRLAAHL